MEYSDSSGIHAGRVRHDQPELAMIFSRIVLIFVTAVVVLAFVGHAACADRTFRMLRSEDWPPELRRAVESYFFEQPDGAAFLSANNRQRRENRQEVISDERAIDSLTAVFADLNDDGIDELFIGMSPYFGVCGTAGCDVKIFTKVDGTWRPLGDVYDSSLEFTILDHKTDGMHDIRSWYVEKRNKYPFIERWDGEEYP